MKKIHVQWKDLAQLAVATWLVSTALEMSVVRSMAVVALLFWGMTVVANTLYRLIVSRPPGDDDSGSGGKDLELPWVQHEGPKQREWRN